MMTRIPSVNIGIPPWETYITYFTITCMVESMDYAGDFKTYLWNLYQCRHPIDLKMEDKTPLLVISVTHWSRVWLNIILEKLYI